MIKVAAKSSGLAIAAYLSIHDDVFFNPHLYQHHQNGPFTHLLRRAPADREPSFLQKALDICKNGIANKTFGLSLVDILQFDNATLAEIEKAFEAAAKDQNNVLADLKTDLDKAPKVPRGDKP